MTRDESSVQHLANADRLAAERDRIESRWQTCGIWGGLLLLAAVALYWAMTLNGGAW